MMHKARRFVQKLALITLKAAKNKTTQQDKSEYEKECISVCRALIHKETSVLLLSPISGKRYIKSHDEQLFIIIESNLITIVNHQYSYNISMWGKPMETIIRMFDIEVEKRREAMEMEIRSNVKHSLANIFKNLSDEKI
jgi:hypothetical protein